MPFFNLSGSDFVEMLVGVRAFRVRDLSKDAKARSPCITFIDELNAAGEGRSQGIIIERENNAGHRAAIDPATTD